MRLKTLGWSLVLCVCSSAAWAHHGGGTFDPKKCFTFQGTVRQVAWVNPHAWIYVEVPKAGAKDELWGFEFGSIPGLVRLGFRPSDFAIGTKVNVTAHVNREIEKHTGSARQLILPDGRTLKGQDVAGATQVGPAGGAPGAATAECPDYNK